MITMHKARCHKGSKMLCNAPTAEEEQSETFWVASSSFLAGSCHLRYLQLKLHEVTKGVKCRNICFTCHLSTSVAPVNLVYCCICCCCCFLFFFSFFVFLRAVQQLRLHAVDIGSKFMFVLIIVIFNFEEQWTWIN